jgi:hypothetical protein
MLRRVGIGGGKVVRDETRADQYRTRLAASVSDESASLVKPGR